MRGCGCNCAVCLSLVVMVIFILLGVASWYLRRRQMAERDKYIMIEKILSEWQDKCILYSHI